MVINLITQASYAKFQILAAKSELGWVYYCITCIFRMSFISRK